MNKDLSKNKVNRAGDTLRNDPMNPDAIQTLKSYRSLYYEITKSIFEHITDKALVVCSNAIVVWRIKRIESILSKLSRESSLKLARMEDIIGCRCIVSSEREVYEIYHSIKDSTNLVVKEHIRDYIKEPKSNGYKSLHISCSLRNNPTYYIEVQIRTQKHHSWATLVETTDSLYMTRIKESGSAPSYPKFPRFHHLLSLSEYTFEEKKELVDIALQYNYLQKVIEVFTKNDCQLRQQWRDIAVNGVRFFLISNSPSGDASIKSFKNLDDAERAYITTYLQNGGENSVVVSSRSTKFENLNSAYSNYTLNYNHLFYQIYNYLSELCVDMYNGGDFLIFPKYYKEFLKMTVMMSKKANSEKVNFEFSEQQLADFRRTKKRKSQEWWASVRSHYEFIKNTFNSTHRKFNTRGLKGLLLRYFQKKAYLRFKNTISGHIDTKP